MSLYLPWLSLIAVLASLGVSALSYVRAGRWKDGEDAARLINRVGEIERDVVEVKSQMKNVATKADIAGITAEVRSLNDNIIKAERGIDRIEGWLIKERT